MAVPPTRLTPRTTLAQRGTFIFAVSEDDDIDVISLKERSLRRNMRWSPVMSTVPFTEFSLKLDCPFVWHGAAVWPVMTDPLNKGRRYVGLVRSSRTRRLKPISGRVHNFLDKSDSASSPREWVDSRGINVCKTAAREFFEETLGALKMYEMPHSKSFGHLWKDYAKELELGRYLFSMIEAVPSWSKYDVCRLYVTFIVEVPWDPNSVVKFRKTRQKINTKSLHFNHPIARLGYPEFFNETCELVWEPWL